MDFAIKIGQRIKELRLKKKLTQDYLAEQSNISAKYLGEIERGEVNVSALILYNIAKSLSVNIQEIYDFNHCDNKIILKNEIIRIINSLPENELKLFYRLLNAIKF